MPDINNVLIAGNLTCDPSFRKTTNGTPVTNFFVASNRKFKDNNGQWRENVCYVGIVAWYKLAESCFENLRKGSAVIVDGELQSRSWRNEDGTNRNVVEIKARRIQFLNRKNDYRDENHLGTESDEKEYEFEDNSSSDQNESLLNNNSNSNSNSNKNAEQEESKDNTTDFEFGYKDFNL